MVPQRFDALTRSLAAPKTRRGLLGGIAALGAGLLGARTGAAQVTQAQCGNMTCRTNPGKCTPGCVCCVWSNGNSRCMPPGGCSGVITTAATTTAAPTTTPAPTTTATPTTTVVPTTTTAAPATTTSTPTTTTVAPTTTTMTPTTTTEAPTSTTTTAAPSTTPSPTTTAPPSCTPDSTATTCQGTGTCGSVLNNCGQPVTCPCGGCFGAGTPIAMANGTSKPIERVVAGDDVLGRGGRATRVLGVLRPVLGDRPLYALNGGPSFVTASHPFLTEEGWKAVDPDAARAEVPGLAIGRLAVGDVLVAAGTGTDERPVPLRSLEGRPADRATQLYNLDVGAPDTYVAYGWIVHNKIR